MTYFEEVAKEIVSKHTSYGEAITDIELRKIVAEILARIAYAVENDGTIYRD